MRKASIRQYAWLYLVVFILVLRKVADMPKSFLSDDPFAAALDAPHVGRRPASALLLLLIPALGLGGLALGMQPRPGAVAPILASDAGDMPSLSERRAGQIVSIEQAHKKVLHWQQENCCGASTPRRRAKLRIWERGYQHRLALLARLSPEPVPPK